MMKRLLILTIICCISMGYVSAYSFYITGSITDLSGDPVVGQEVRIYTLSLNNPSIVTTDAAGNYSEQYWIQTGYFPTFYVQTWEWCHGEFTNNVQTVTGFNGISHINFQMCQQLNVPDKSIADFQTQKITNHLWGFINTSRGEIDSLRFSFGNGLSTTDNVFVYEYPDHGLFSACLTIYPVNSGIDETCSLVPVGPWEFASGHVEMNNIDLPNGELFVYQLTGNNKENIWTYKIDIEDGEFIIPFLLFEDYFIQAVPTFDISGPYFPKYLPTYYGQSLLWQDADSIDLTGSISHPEIDLLSYDEIFYGHGSISGSIKRYDTIPHELDPIWIENNLIPPVTVFLLDESETTLDFRFIEVDGSFSFEDIPYGDYIIRTEKFRSAPYDVHISISEENPHEKDIDIQVYDESIILDIKELTSINNGISLYPNPVKETLFIQFENNFSGEITIYDLSGKAIHIQEHNSNNKIFINTLQFPSGIYLLKIQLENGVIVHEMFNKVR